MKMAASTKQNELSATDENIIAFFNNEFGDNVKSLSKAKDFFATINETKSSVEKELSTASSEVPNEIEHAIQDAEDVGKSITRIDHQRETLHHDILDHVRVIQPMVEQLTKLMQQINELEKYSNYLTFVTRVEELSSEIQAALITESMEMSVKAFREMTSLYTSLKCSHCTNLISFVKDTILFWYKILKEKIASEFEDTLKAMKWPLVAATIKAPTVQNPADLQQTMEALFNQLLQLQLPDTLSPTTSEGHPSLSPITSIKPLILPLQLMVKPLKKRFKYHFYGNKQTNSLNKPEWYFTQVLGWIRDHSNFLDKKVQALLSDVGKQSVDAKVEFMRGLVTLVMEKMIFDLPEVLFNEHLFSHLIDETLLFDRELHMNCGYPTNLPACLSVLTEGDAFEKWIDIERKFAIEKMDAMLSSDTAWLSQYKDISDVDELKVPECGESFMTLMLTMTDRYKPLPHPTHRLRFLDLQLELLDDFRVRLVQVMKGEAHNPLGQCFCSILNTVYYVAEVLREWSELVFFLELQFHKLHYSSSNLPLVSQVDGSNQSSSFDLSQMSEVCEDSKLMGIESTAFDDIVNLFERMKNDMLKNLVGHVFTDVKARSQPYRKDRWLALPSQKDVSLGLSPSACEMLLVLKDHLLRVGQLINKPVFTHFWQRFADKLSRFIYEEVIVMNHFNDGGAAQLQFDMTRNLFPLFGEFTQKPENYFRDIKESCILLTLNAGSAILLKDVLHTALHGPKPDPSNYRSDPKAALHDIGVFKLNPQQAELVLSLRTNLSIS